MLQDQDNQKNLLLAIVLSVAVLLAWQIFYAGPKLKEEQERRRDPPGAAGKDQGANAPGAPTTAPDVDARQAQARCPAPSSVTTAANRDAAVAREPARAHRDAEPEGLDRAQGRPHRRSRAGQVSRDGRSQEPQRRAVLALGSAASLLRRVRLGRRRRRDAADAGRRHALARREGRHADAGLARDAGVGQRARAWSSAARSPSMPTTCSPSPTRSRTRPAAAVTLHPYALISRHGMPKIEGFYILHEGLIGVLGEPACRSCSYADLLKDGGTKTFKQTGGWLGITDKYWAAALIPDQKACLTKPASRGSEGRRRTLPDRFLQRGPSRSRPAPSRPSQQPVRRRQAGEPDRGLQREARRRAVRPADRLGLVLFHHQAAVQAAALAQPVASATTVSPSSPPPCS